jgi:hypothetical protein
LSKRPILGEGRGEIGEGEEEIGRMDSRGRKRKRRNVEERNVMMEEPQGNKDETPKPPVHHNVEGQCFIGADPCRLLL